jgi:hypothetical protein
MIGMTVRIGNRKVRLDELVAKHHAGQSPHDTPLIRDYQARWDGLLSQSKEMPAIDTTPERLSQIPSDRVRYVDKTVDNPAGMLVRLLGINYDPSPSNNPADVRKLDAPAGHDGVPYYLVMTVPARAGRTSCGHGKPYTPCCALCRNMIEPGFFIFDRNALIEGFYVGPNQNPIDRHHSLLVSAEQRPQGNITTQDIRTAMEFSYVMNQFLIYNGPKTGGTVPHLHFQGFDHRMGNEYPTPVQVLVDDVRGSMTRLNGNSIDFELDAYPGKHRFFMGAGAADKAMRHVDALGRDALYNMFIDKDVVGVVSRRADPERNPVQRPETESLWAGLEMLGCIVVPKPHLARNLTYNTIDNAMRDTLAPR